MCVWDSQSAAGNVFSFKCELSWLFRNNYLDVYVINKIIHGCLEIWNFSSGVQLELNTRREIPYLHAPIYYSLYLWIAQKLPVLFIQHIVDIFFINVAYAKLPNGIH